MRLILSLCICLLFVNFSLAQVCPITEEFISDYKDRITESTKSYFASLSNLIDKDLSYDDKGIISRQVRQQFQSDAVVVENDIDKLKTERYKLPEYLANLTNAYDKEIVEINPTITSVSQIYYDELYDNYLMMVDVTRQIQEYNEKGEPKGRPKEKELQIYYLFKACAQPKIMSVQLTKTKKNPFDGKSEVKPVTKEEAEKTIIRSKPYLQFDVTPSGADVVVDNMSVAVVKGQKIETTQGIKTITISAPGYNSETINVGVADTGITLVRKTLSQKMGSISITPADSRFVGATATLILKGQKDVKLGGLPIVNYQLPYGVYKVSMTQYCRIAKRYTLTISDSNPSQKLSVALATASGITNGVNAFLGAATGYQVKDPCEGVK